jgi:hypothetical protein
LKSQLGSGTNTSAVDPSASANPSNSPSNGPVFNGGSAEGNRGGGGSSDNNPASTHTGNGFSQGGKSQASTHRISEIVVVWSAVVGLIVGGMFTML